MVIYFRRPFKRVEIKDEVKLANMAFDYIHANPAFHHIVNDFTNYHWSSYKAYLSDKSTQLPRNEIISFYGGLEAFVRVS